MSLLKEVNASATVAWSPIKHRSNLIALGSKDGVGVGFESYGGELQLMSMDFADVSPAPIQLGSIKTSSRFLSLSWADVVRHQSSMELGVLAGGMADGTVNIWDPSKIAANAPAEVGKVSRHKGPVNAVQFNPHPEMSHLLASGGGDGEVYVMSLDKLNAPQVYTPGGPNYTATPGNEITCLAWNTQVAHILASGSQNGSTVVWDMKSKKPFCELKDMSRSPVSCVAWNPNEGLHIITASSDDQRPVLRLWDLRSSTSTPLAELHGHTAGILSMSWCPNDAGFVLSSAKDNRTLLWDLFTGQPFFELPSNVPTQPVGGSFFSGGGGGQRRFNVQWSPKIPAVASACTFDGKVQVWGLTGSGTGATRAPKWSTRPVSASFGFGGKLVVTNARSSTPQQQQQYGQPKEFRPVHIHKISSDPSIVAGADLLEQALAQKDFQRHCDAKVASANTPADKATWSFMKILFDRASARTQLLLHLGYDSNQIKADARTYLGKDEPLEAADTSAPLPPPQAQPTVSAADVFGAAPPPPDLAPPPHTPPKKAGAIPIDTSERIQGAQGPTYTEASESIIKRLLLVGDFDAAVDVCLANFQLADALLLACQGGEELWVKTQEACLAAGKARPFMKIVKAMMKRDLAALVADSDGHQWTETLAILTTYATGDEFGVLVDQLAAKLEALGDVASATLCYMCSFNVEKTVTAWVKEAAIESKARDSVLVLQDLIEKVSIFAQASDNPDQELNPQVASQFAAYASLMAGQGRLDIAGRYAKYADVSCAIIRDRIYHAAPNPQLPVEDMEQPLNLLPTELLLNTNSRSLNNNSTLIRAITPNPKPQRTPLLRLLLTTPKPLLRRTRRSTDLTLLLPWVGMAPPALMARRLHLLLRTVAHLLQRMAQPPLHLKGMVLHPPKARGMELLHLRTERRPLLMALVHPVRRTAPLPQFPLQATAALLLALGGSKRSSLKGVGFGAPQQGSAPPAHGGFAPPAAAALPNPSSRISTIPVDISKGKADGFVSSVGNKDLIRKYGNSTNAILSPTEKEKAAGFHNQPSPAPVAAAPAVVLGATDNVSAEDLPIVRGFNDLVALLEGSQLSPIEAKQLPEIQKSKDLLFTKLNTGELAPNVVKSLHDMVLAFARQDFRAAGQIHTSLTTTDWAQHKEWLRGVKTLINLGVKRFR
ncbi:hypothetical protein DYB26_001302 [Aphanomyces astaci]|uniref:Anaphase-promoting complex subunit 4-like WD40 domain-containing protein n=1 Tax=Aphanomyces astaci TaxID=112090 RepID=A0A3R7FKV3_APHAT|nr:hypothetical protein DYB26_001302 [Aphanomyces astaci]